MVAIIGLLFAAFLTRFRSRCRLEIEILVIRHQLNILRRVAPKAVLELNDQARRKLPATVLGILYDALSKGCQDWGWPHSCPPIIIKDDWQVFWSIDEWYDVDRSCGIIFGVEEVTAESLIDAEDPSERPYLYLYYAGAKKMRSLSKAGLREAVRRVRPSLRLTNLNLNPIINGDDGYLVTQSLESTLTIHSLREGQEQEMKAHFLQKAKVFTETLLPVVTGLATGKR
jgi:hypothetical protein